MKTALLCCALVLGACGGAVETDRTAEPLPREFPFDYLTIALNGAGVLVDGDTPTFTATFESGQERQAGGLYPVQYGIGFFFPVTGRLRVDFTRCLDEDAGFYDRTCDVELSAFELSVTPRADLPDPFMDESTFALAEPTTGTARRYAGDDTYEMFVESATLRAATRTGASSNEYQGGLEITLGELAHVTAQMEK